MTTTREVGRRAEELAASWLEAKGYQIVAANYRTRYGEVDLVCREGETICFVEVRSRSSPAYGSPAQSVDRAKRRRVVGAATSWAMGHGGLDRLMRFDVVSVALGSPPRLELFRGAFDAEGLGF